MLGSLNIWLKLWQKFSKVLFFLVSPLIFHLWIFFFHFFNLDSSMSTLSIISAFPRCQSSSSGLQLIIIFMINRLIILSLKCLFYVIISHSPKRVPTNDLFCLTNNPTVQFLTTGSKYSSFCIKTVREIFSVRPKKYQKKVPLCTSISLNVNCTQPQYLNSPVILSFRVKTK